MCNHVGIYKLYCDYSIKLESLTVKFGAKKYFLSVIMIDHQQDAVRLLDHPADDAPEYR